MAKISKEQRFSESLYKGLNTLDDFNYPLIAYAFSRYGLGVHRNLFELVLAFLNKWAGMYESGEVEPGDGMYLICQSSHRMVAALTTPRSR